MCLALAALAGACGNDDNDSADGASSTPVTTATSTSTSGATSTSSGGSSAPSTTGASDDVDESAVLRVGLDFTRGGRYSLDSRFYASDVVSPYMYQLYAPLVVVDPVRLEYTPYLADSFEVVDGQTLKVTIRADGNFHDGRPVTAEDAKVTIEIQKSNQAEGASNVNSAIQSVESVEVVDDKTFIVHFSRPAVLAMYEMLVGPEFLISPADAGAEQETNPVGNGPFRFASGTKDQDIELEKWADFWDADNVQLGGIRYLALPGGNPQTTALLAGDIDVAMDIGAEGFDAVDGRDSLEARALVNTTRYLYVIFCAASGHFWEDPALRKAVGYATDRAQISSVLHGEHGAPLNQFWPKGHPYHDDALDEEFAFDLATAQELLAQATVPADPVDGMWVPTIPEAADIALILNQQWGELGLSIEPVPTNDLTGEALQPAKAEPPTLERGDSIIVENTRAGLTRLTRQIKPASIVNSCHYRNDRLTEIEAELISLAPDDPQAAALWKEASRIVLEEPAPFMILAQKPTFVGVSTAIGGIEDNDFRAATEGSFQFHSWFVNAG